MEHDLRTAGSDKASNDIIQKAIVQLDRNFRIPVDRQNLINAKD